MIGRITQCPSNTRRATILIVVLWISFGLVSVALYFGHTTGQEYRAADNGLGGLQAEQAIEGTRRYIGYVLREFIEPGLLPDLEEDEYIAEELPIGESTVWIIGRGEDQLFENNQPTFAVTDEAGKLNLNTATQDMLESLPNMTYELAGAILDWRDEDDEIRQDGAETQDYNLRPEPYYCKNADFESVEELNLLFGASEELLYGEDTNQNGVLDPNEDDGDLSYPPDNGDGELDPGLVEFVTVWSREPQTDADGNARIDVSSNNDRQSLQELLTTELGEQRANEVLANAGALNQMGSILEFYIRSQMTQDEFMTIEGSIAASGNADDFEGLINVATAPWQVLACLPGIDEGTARSMVAYRQNLDFASRQSVAWVKDSLDEELALGIGSRITGRSYQITLDVVALGRVGHGFRRSKMVIDTTTGEPKMIYRHDLSRAGWPLGLQLYDQIFNDTES